MRINSLMVLLVIVLFTDVQSYRVLFVSVPSFSHLNALVSIARAVIEHHPDITVSFALFDEDIKRIQKKVPEINIVRLGSVAACSGSFNYRVNIDESNSQFIGRVSLPRILSIYEQMHMHLLTADIAVNFDLLVIDMYAYAAQDLAHDMEVPFVIHSCASTQGVFGLPSWIPRGFDGRTPDDLQASLFARLDNALVEPLRLAFYLGPGLMELHHLRRRANRTTQSIHPLLLRSPMQRWQGHPILLPFPMAFDFLWARTPNYHFLGFVLDKQEYETMPHQPDEIEAWLNSTREPDEFVVLLAFGSLTNLSEHTWSIIVSSLNLVHHMRMLLAVTDEKCRLFVSGLANSINPHRILIRSWVAQQRVLSHRHTRLFVNHGGLNSIGEAVYAQKPTIILPGFGDQPGNGARMRVLNVSVVLSRHTLTAEVFAEAVQSLVDNNRRLSITKHLERLHELSESEGGGAGRAAQLIDTWLRNGYAHLNTLDHYLPFWISYEWDINIAIIIVIYTAWRVIDWCFKRDIKIGEKKKML